MCIHLYFGAMHKCAAQKWPVCCGVNWPRSVATQMSSLTPMLSVYIYQNSAVLIAGVLGVPEHSQNLGVQKRGKA